jgi:hypothetical protein
VLKRRQGEEEGELQARRGGVEQELASVQPLIDQARKAVGQVRLTNLEETPGKCNFLIMMIHSVIEYCDVSHSQILTVRALSFASCTNTWPQIKKENIDEIRSLKMPPDAIRDVLEVCGWVLASEMRQEAGGAFYTRMALWCAT